MGTKLVKKSIGLKSIPDTKKATGLRGRLTQKYKQAISKSGSEQDEYNRPNSEKSQRDRVWSI